MIRKIPSCNLCGVDLAKGFEDDKAVRLMWVGDNIYFRGLHYNEASEKIICGQCLDALTVAIKGHQSHEDQKEIAAQLRASKRTHQGLAQTSEPVEVPGVRLLPDQNAIGLLCLLEIATAWQVDSGAGAGHGDRRDGQGNGGQEYAAGSVSEGCQAG